MSNSKPSIPKGTRDFGPEESAKRSYIIGIITKNFIKYGFQKIETPTMEQLSVLTGKYGDEGDQLIFKIINSGDFLKKSETSDFENGSSALLPKISEKGLRYDLTVPFARFVVQNQHQITFPFKRFQIQPVWRADRPQKGRYREFYQCDADIIGSDSLWNEAELTMLIHDVFRDLGYHKFQLKINHRKVLNGLAEFVGLSGREIPFCVSIDKLDKIGREKVEIELLELGATQDKLSQLFSLFENSNSISLKIDALAEIIGSNKGIEELKQFQGYLETSQNTNYQIDLDLSLARGLTYYTGMIFEVKATDVKIGSISGGGRYDDLTGVFGLNGISGVGISFGLDRIYDVMEDRKIFPSSSENSSQVLIAHFDEPSFLHGMSVLSALREANIRAELYPDSTKIKKQFNYADKMKIQHVLVIGSDEIESKKYAFKNMLDGTQENKSINEIISYFQSKI
ncbi:MAG: histidine--tRNA ligase [Cyclobacteriaceae bacterium]